MPLTSSRTIIIQATARVARVGVSVLLIDDLVYSFSPAKPSKPGWPAAVPLQHADRAPGMATRIAVTESTPLSVAVAAGTSTALRTV
jgi:hypothetical protein